MSQYQTAAQLLENIENRLGFYRSLVVALGMVVMLTLGFVIHAAWTDGEDEVARKLMSISVFASLWASDRYRIAVALAETRKGGR